MASTATPHDLRSRLEGIGTERDPGTFRTFQSLAWRRYVDTKKLRDAQRRSLEVFRARTSA